MKEKLNKFNFIKTKTLFCVKNTAKRMKKQVTERKTFAKHISNNGLVLKLCK